MGGVFRWFKARLSRRFLLWFGLALFPVLFALFIFTYLSFQDRERLLKSQVKENQLSQVLKVEEFFRNRYEPVSKEVLVNTMKLADGELFEAFKRYPHANEDEEQKTELVKLGNELLYEEIVPKAGIEFSGGEMTLFAGRFRYTPFISQVLKFDFRKEGREDFIDFIATSGLGGEEPRRYTGKEKQTAIDFLKFMDEFRHFQALRAQWIPVRSWPDYKDQPANGLFPVSFLQARDLKTVFRPHNLLKDYFSGEDIQEGKLPGLRVAVKNMLVERYDLLEKMVQLRSMVMGLKSDLRRRIEGIQRVTQSDSDIVFHSLVDVEELIETALSKLRTSTNLKENLSLLPFLENCRARLIKVQSARKTLLIDYKESYSHYLADNSVLRVQSGEGELPGFEELQSILDSKGAMEMHAQHTPLMVLYYLTKLQDRGLRGSDWEFLATSLDCYHFDYYSLKHYKDNIIHLAIKPGGRELGVYFVLSKWMGIGELEKTDWNVFKNMIEHLGKYVVTGPFALNNSKDAYVQALISGPSLADTRGNFIELEAAGGGLYLSWDVTPSTFDPFRFFIGHSSKPFAMPMLILKSAEFQRFFLRKFNVNLPYHLKKQMEEKASAVGWEKEFARLYLEQTPEDIRSQFPRLSFKKIHPDLYKLYRDLAKLNPYIEPEVLEEVVDGVSPIHFVLHFLGLNRDYLISRTELWNGATKVKLLAFQDKVLGTGFRQDQYMEVAIKGLMPERYKADFKKWQEDPSRPFQFEYRDSDGKTQLGSIISSQVLPEYCFLLSMDSSIAYKELKYLKALLFSLSLLALLLGLGLGRTLARNVVKPVDDLTQSVTAFSDGSIKEPVRVKCQDEIGQMAFFFNQLVGNIQSKMGEMDSINSLNQLLLEGKGLKELINYSCLEFARSVKSPVACLAFFEQTSREKLLAHALHGEYEEDSYEELVEGVRDFVVNLDANEEFVFLEKASLGALGEFENVLLHRIRPQSEPLQAVSEILDEVTPETLKDKSKEVESEGFLVLTDVNQEILDNEKKDFIRSFSSQTGTVIIKAYLDKVKKDNEEGQNIQEGLMPSEAPESYGALDFSYSFVAAKYLGGDFFDFVEYDNKRHVGMLISDVSGKGIGPSLFGTTCKAYLRMLAQDPEKTGDTLDQMNEQLCVNKKNSLFATAFYLSYNIDTKVAHYSCAGHNKMFWYRKATHSIEDLNAKGLVLGMFTPAMYETKSIQMEDGDWIILYTDGVNELEDPHLNLYGFERFEKLILDNVDGDAAQFKEVLLKDLEDFRRERAPSDDITFIAMRVVGDPVEEKSEESDFSS